MTREEFHKQVSELVANGMLKQDAFVKCFNIDSPFNTYSTYKVWKSRNSIKEPTMMKCAKCHELVERKSHSHKYCVKCSKRKPTPSQWHTVVRDNSSREPEKVKSITKLKRDIERSERNRKELISKVETILKRYKECNTCEELYYSYSKKDQSYCSTLCRSAKVCIDMFPRDKECVSCGIKFTRPYGKCGSRAFCSDKCKKERRKELRRENKRKRKGIKTHIKRAKHYGKRYEIIKRKEVFKEENYVCYLCGKTTDIKLPAGHKDRPTLDHVIPLSNTDEIGMKYGHHIRENVRCCCRDCNTKKGIKILEVIDPAPMQKQLTF